MSLIKGTEVVVITESDIHDCLSLYHWAKKHSVNELKGSLKYRAMFGSYR